MDETVETFAEAVVAVLGTGDVAAFDVAVLVGGVDHVGDQGDEDAVGAAVEGFVETGGEDAGFEAGGAAHGLLGDGDGLEDPAEIDKFKADLVATYQPINSQELFAIESIAIAQQSLSLIHI